MNQTRSPVTMTEQPGKKPLFSREQIFIITRPHWLIPTQTIVVFLFLSLVTFSTSVIGFLSLYPSPALFVLSVLLIFMCSFMFIAKIVADWYFHYYMITDRKISEVCYLPLSTHFINEVLLDRVKCTEVDVRSDGIFNQVVGIGSVTVTFDRPTKQDAFVFWNVGNAQEIGTLLTGQFVDTKRQETTIYYKLPESNREYYTEEIMPGFQM